MKRLPLLLAAIALVGAGCAEPEPVPSVVEAAPEEVRMPLPKEVRGIYWTAQTAGTKRGDELLAYMRETGLNAAVIDLKMDDGELAFVPDDETLRAYAMEQPVIAGLDALTRKLADAGLYRIARIAVMRDSAYASAHAEAALRFPKGSLWRDNTGAAWVDPADPGVAAYALALGREAYARGFDEIQYDYVRFASDGAISSIRYPAYDGTLPKEEVMRAFFKTVGGTLKEEGIPVSFDLFGMTFESVDDFNIGQRLIDAYPHADFVSPMTYPSHYAAGFQGYRNPALYPYEVPTHSFESGKAMLEKELGVPQGESASHIRPWIQDFDIGAIYTAARIEAQIRAARDAGASGWMLWNARNVYERAEYVKE
ncbi:hypothetical protein A2856_03260 [Candidatus Uhrbacteria bacterium RIFCSPHIGHO2_01_FULL_63_20]|uniref:DUF4015 domain-containing protein n=1 Tax=Candidatus Uhrbacteria bacterium RIFCSPHIGHO2_01_FULL_63_20 TaxID=1802385 RepID=A0A1F7TMJ9_9BACT|nr:MAG: hypothetical protein A2856_03260 [Candidatus Uhrbacteria bacterium RIFCSPHIGHO2_01_FULL_63_20]